MFSENLPSAILVSQNCDEDGMEFTMRIPEGFRGRIYTHKHYGRSQCYVRGTGGKTYTLRIPGVNGFPDCGTEKVSTFNCMRLIIKNSWPFENEQKKAFLYNLVPSMVTL